MARLDLKKLEAAQARLGEAVADPSRWPSLMEDICAAVAATGAILLQSDSRAPNVPATPSIDELITSYFGNNLHVQDVRASRGVPLQLSGRRAIRDQDLFSSERAMLNDMLYREIGRLGYRWWSAISFQSGPSLWALSIQRRITEGMFEDDEMTALAALSGPLTDVATLSRLVGQQVLQGSLNAFEMINEPAIAMTASGIVLDANAQATRLFDDEFRVCLGRLFMRDSKASAELELRLKYYPQEGQLRPRSRRPGGNAVIARRQFRRPILIRLLPVYGPARSPFLGARFILILRDMEAIRRPPLEVIAETFSLSPAEAKVASMIAAGSSPQEIADTLMLSRETVRNQIKAIFGKTGVRRQNELAALIARLQL